MNEALLRLTFRVLPGLILLFASVFEVSNSAAASDAPDRWSRGDIAALFPLAPDGWRHSKIELEPRKTASTDFETFMNAMNDDYGGLVSVSLRAVRHYYADERKVTITIDSDDIEAAINIDAIAAAFDTDGATRTQLESEGFSVVRHEGYVGVAMQSTDKTGRAFRVDSSGVIAFECSYFDCSEFLDSMINQIDFDLLAEFMAFDHLLERSAFNE